MQEAFFTDYLTSLQSNRMCAFVYTHTRTLSCAMHILMHICTLTHTCTISEALLTGHILTSLQANSMCSFIFLRTHSQALDSHFIRYLISLHWHTRLSTYIRTSMHSKHARTQARTSTHKHTQARTHACTHTHAHTRMHTHACTHTHPHTRMHTHTCTHTHIHTHMHTHACTHMHAPMRTHIMCNHLHVFFVPSISHVFLLLEYPRRLPPR